MCCTCDGCSHALRPLGRAMRVRRHTRVRHKYRACGVSYEGHTCSCACMHSEVICWPQARAGVGVEVGLWHTDGELRAHESRGLLGAYIVVNLQSRSDVRKRKINTLNLSL